MRRGPCEVRERTGVVQEQVNQYARDQIWHRSAGGWGGSRLRLKPLGLGILHEAGLTRFGRLKPDLRCSLFVSQLAVGDLDRTRERGRRALRRRSLRHLVLVRNVLQEML